MYRHSQPVVSFLSGQLIDRFRDGLDTVNAAHGSESAELECKIDSFLFIQGMNVGLARPQSGETDAVAFESLDETGLDEAKRPAFEGGGAFGFGEARRGGAGQLPDGDFQLTGGVGADAEFISRPAGVEDERWIGAGFLSGLHSLFLSGGLGFDVSLAAAVFGHG